MSDNRISPAMGIIAVKMDNSSNKKAGIKSGLFLFQKSAIIFVVFGQLDHQISDIAARVDELGPFCFKTVI